MEYVYVVCAGCVYGTCRVCSRVCLVCASYVLGLCSHLAGCDTADQTEPSMEPFCSYFSPLLKARGQFAGAGSFVTICSWLDNGSLGPLQGLNAM